MSQNSGFRVWASSAKRCTDAGSGNVTLVEFAVNALESAETLCFILNELPLSPPKEFTNLIVTPFQLQVDAEFWTPTPPSQVVSVLAWGPEEERRKER